jgi:Uri superfamily endonuclease
MEHSLEEEVTPWVPDGGWRRLAAADINRPGTYVLVLRLERGGRMPIGRLGVWPLAAGWYAYVGSARGPGGLAARIGHHLRPASRPRWHVDWLRRRAAPREIWAGPLDTLGEHCWLEVCRQLPGASVPVPGFGSSDCTRCPAHLLAFDRAPDWDAFRCRLARHECSGRGMEQDAEALPAAREQPFVGRFRVRRINS